MRDVEEVDYVYHVKTKETKKYSRTEKLLAKQGIKEKSNQSPKGGFRRKKEAKVYPGIQGDKDSHVHMITPVRFSTMDDGPYPASYGDSYNYPQAVPLEPHPHPYLSEAIVAAARGATDQFFDQMKAIAGIAEKVMQVRPPMHVNCKCEALAEKWYDYIARRCQCVYDRK